MFAELEPNNNAEYLTKQNVMDSIWKCIDGALKPEQLVTALNEEKPFVGDDLLKERLEIETLESLKLIAKKEAFNQKYIKIKTRLFYKQQKFNLLREEGEGYSKLITELGQTELNNKILENIQSLIGCFNLDPNRVLDIILESFENNPAMHVAFINLLKAYKAEDETICQIIGFKFQSLHQQEKDLLAQHQQMQTENTDKLDAHFYQNHLKFLNSTLYTVTSYLLKYKMIDLDLLMPHLYPNDQQIQQFYKEDFESARQYAKKLTIVNLSDAKPTNDSSKSSDQNSVVDHQHQQQMKQQEELRAQLQAQLNRLDNQRVSLVRSLVEIGDFKTCAKLVERLPQWYLATYPDVAVEICKSINMSVIDPIYKKSNSLSKYLKDKYVNGRYSASSKTKTSSPTNQISSTTIQESLSDLLGNFVQTVLPILSALGPGVSFDTSLFTKLIRICIEFLESNKLANKSSETNSQEMQSKESSPPPPPINNIADTEQLTTAQAIALLNANELAFYNQIYTLLNDVLMPSLGMIVMNPCLAIELWNLLKLFPYEMRYYLYNNCRQYTYKHFPQLIRIKAECQEKIKYLLKRLTKENVKIHGRQIGKLSHNNPIIVCDYILTQIQRYDNFINPIVDSLKFLTPLSYDILSYCTIVAISDADKDKMKHDSISISSWLHSVATFCALTFKKYPIELTAIIQYVINQLKNRKSYDLLILQEIVQKMCGIEVLSEVNDLQLEAMAGGDILRQEAGYFNPIRNIKKCANRLKEALADHGLILPLCILLSQHRDYTVFLDQAERESLNQVEKRHLKLTGSLYDQCQDSLVQFSQFLSTTLTTEEYIEIFPKIDELVNEYHVSADVAFFLSRPMYAHHINSKFDELRRMDRMTKSAEKPTKTQRYLESIDVVMQPVIDLVRTLHPPKIWEDMSPLFYTTFWTLSMNDCFVPTNAYEKQRASLKQKLNALDDNTDLTKTKQRKEKEKILIMLEKLTEEENKQKDHVQHVKARFEKEKEFWFPQKSKTKNETITVFLQLCIFSRCLFTQIDAFYCAKFIQIIHSLKTPNFSTIICYDRIFSDISYSIASLTDNEARRYGRFLLGLLETVMSWHSDPAVFDTECAQFPGFLTVFRNALNTTSTQSTTSNKQEQLDYENFRHVCHKWHYKLTKSFIVCLESEEYLQMRNSLIILTKILPHYPRLTGFCSALEKRVEKITQVEKDKKQDIHTLAVVYLGQLKLRKQHMVDEAKFHLKEQTSSTNTSFSSKTTDSQKSTSQKAATTTTEKFKQPAVPAKGSTSSMSNGSQQASSSSSFASKQISAVLQQVSSSSSSASSSKSTNGQAATSSTTASSSSNKSSSSQQQNVSKSAAPSSSTTASSSSTNGKEASSRIIVNSSAPTAVSTQNSPPHSKPSRSDDSKERSYSNAPSNGTTNVVSGSSSKSLKRSEKTSQSSPSSSSQPSSLTPTRSSRTNGALNEFSPTSSVSSDELMSPKRASSQTGHANRHKSHSRSTSPKGNNGSHYKTISSNHEKSKRLKTTEEPNGNGNSTSYNNGNTNGSSNDYVSSQSSSTKRKLSRDRGERSEKKDHRKRDHSLEDGTDMQHQKRSKSDEAKKKSTSVSSSSSSSMMMPQQSTMSSSSSQSSKRSSKKHESSKDEFQMINGNSSNHVILNSSSSKHRSTSSIDDNSSRRSHDKTSHYTKEKK